MDVCNVLYRNKSHIPETPNEEGLISLQDVASWSSAAAIRPRNESSTFSASIKLPTQNECNHLLKPKTMSTPLETPSQNLLTLTRPLPSVHYLSIYSRPGKILERSKLAGSSRVLTSHVSTLRLLVGQHCMF
jgi:hypothetical protein